MSFPEEPRPGRECASGLPGSGGVEGNRFRPVAEGHRLAERLPVADDEVQEHASEGLPEAGRARRLGQRRPEQRAACLLQLVDAERQQHQRGEHRSPRTFGAGASCRGRSCARTRSLGSSGCCTFRSRSASAPARRASCPLRSICPPAGP